MLQEILRLIKPLTPKETSEELSIIHASNNIQVIKNETLPYNTLVVSKELFDLIHENATNDRTIDN